jgi:hypothetical protein
LRCILGAKWQTVNERPKEKVAVIALFADKLDAAPDDYFEHGNANAI